MYNVSNSTIYVLVGTSYLLHVKGTENVKIKEIMNDERAMQYLIPAQ